MKFQLQRFLFALLAAVLFAGTAGAQVLAKVQGTCTDDDGKPIAGATVQFLNTENGQKAEVKTDSKGKYLIISLTPGTYKVSLIQNGNTLWYFNNYPARSVEDADTVDFNLAKEHAGAGGGKPTAEQQKRIEEAQKQRKDAEFIKGLNDKLTQANTLEQAGNWDQAIALMTEATTAAPDKDLLWARLGEAQLGAGAAAKADPDGAKIHYEKAADAYKKAIELKPADGTYHNNLGQAYAKTGRSKEALAEYTAAAQNDPEHAATYYFNLGAILTNQATVEHDQAAKTKDLQDANVAFDKAIAAKPDYGEAYYQKATNLAQMATADKAGNVVAAPGTLDAYNKYLEVAPDGPHAADVKMMIAAFGGTVQTSYKKPKAK